MDRSYRSSGRGVQYFEAEQFHFELEPFRPEAKQTKNRIISLRDQPASPKAQRVSRLSQFCSKQVDVLPTFTHEVGFAMQFAGISEPEAIFVEGVGLWREAIPHRIVSVYISRFRQLHLDYKKVSISPHPTVTARSQQDSRLSRRTRRLHSEPTLTATQRQA